MEDSYGYWIRNLETVLVLLLLHLKGIFIKKRSKGDRCSAFNRKIMSEYSKEFNDKNDFQKAVKSLLDFQKRHNIIRKDYEELLAITEEFKNDGVKFDATYRAALKGFLSIIESDIYGLNQLDSYQGYNDRHSFTDKFKKTFKKFFKDAGKENILQEFLDSKFEDLKSIKRKRDNLVHPKTTEDIISASLNEFLILKKAFNDYTEFLHSLVSNFFINVKLSSSIDIDNLFTNPD